MNVMSSLLRIAFAFVVLAFTISAESTTSDWDSWVGIIQRFIGDDPSSYQAQIVSVPLLMDWEDKKSDDYNFCAFADSISGDGIEYNKRGGSFYNSYQLFVDSIELPRQAQTDAAKLKEAEMLSKRLHSELGDLEKAIDSDWKKFDANQRMSKPQEKWIGFSQWMNASEFSAKLASQRLAIARADRNARFLAGTMPSAYEAVERAHDLSGIHLVSGLGGKQYQCPEYNSSRLNVDGERRISWSVGTITSRQKTVLRSRRLSGIQIGRPFITAYDRAGKPVNSLKLQTIEYEMRFDDMAVVIINPGVWYTQELVSTFRKGPFVPASSLAGAEVVWGPKGKLGWHPVKLLIASGANFSLTVDENSYQNLVRLFSENGQLAVGPYIFTHERLTSDLSKNRQARKISFRQISTAPMILGVLNGPNFD